METLDEIKECLLELNRLLMKVENLQKFEESDLNKCSAEYEKFWGSEDKVLSLEELSSDDLFIKRIQLGMWGMYQSGKEKKEEFI